MCFVWCADVDVTFSLLNLSFISRLLHVHEWIMSVQLYDISSVVIISYFSIMQEFHKHRYLSLLKYFFSSVAIGDLQI